MKFVSITGPKGDIDRVAEAYLTRYEIQLENALSELKTVQNLKPFTEINPYKDLLAKANEYIEVLKTKDEPMKEFTLDESVQTIENIKTSLQDLLKTKDELKEKKEHFSSLLNIIEPFQSFEMEISKIINFKFVKFRFGKIPVEYFDKLDRYVYDNIDTIFLKCHSDNEYIWGVYFVPSSIVDKVDAIYASLHFERIFLPNDFQKTPLQECNRLKNKIHQLKTDILKINNTIQSKLEASKADLLAAKMRLQKINDNFDIRKLAACTNKENREFYILCGWIPEKQIPTFLKEVQQDPNVFCVVEDEHSTTFSTPPTKLKNPKIFKPFELFIRMYGLPAYNEFDPTIFLAITYTFIFGCMFGDVGQGLLLVIGGALIYKIKKMDLAAVIAVAGVFSTIFGFLYGSVFGFEDLIPALWLHPMLHTVKLPIVGSINTVLVIAVAFGMFLILTAMVLNIINGIKQKDISKIIFDTNGVAGLVFYGSIVASVVLIMTGHTLVGGIFIVIMFVIPLIMIAFKEPITNFLLKRKEEAHESKVMFLLQTFFELFEIVLSYMTNTISFVRIGAFALSHAGMMEVVRLLANAENGGSTNWVVFILGNLLVMGLEGLIVGIHVLRLEYYELFSRFFSGSGREFVPYSQRIKKEKKK